jgi:hypothetical protein
MFIKFVCMSLISFVEQFYVIVLELLLMCCLYGWLIYCAVSVTSNEVGNR